ncbi:MAG TPA: hypothetical protein VIH76_06500 [Candidatus Acidoferrales bacterium]
MFAAFDRAFGTIETFGARAASRRKFAIAVAGIAPILLRVSFLKWFAVPIPAVHDEFSYLLAADTFAHGRLTNPPHPMWIFFETFHVNMQPTYMSKYPPGQGAVLALGQLLGHPWIGVLLSVGVMCGAIVWALQGWLPARWAFLGGVLAALQFGVFNYWMDSYWGGAVAAIGGALVVGALPRIFRCQRPRDSLVFGVGAAILAVTRPWEGALFCVAAIIALAIWMLRKRRLRWRVTLLRVVASAALVFIATGAFVSYDNWRVTGDPLLFPYRLNDRTYMSAPHFAWQKLDAPREYRNAEFDSYYNVWVRSIWKQNHLDASWRGIKNGVLSKLEELREFYLPDELSFVMLVTLPWLWRDRKVRSLSFLVAVCLAAVIAVVWFEPHYAAPMTAALFGIVVQAIRYLRRWKWRGRAIGIRITHAVVIFAFALIPVHAWMSWHHPRDTNDEHTRYRAKFASELESAPGEQLVIVRYSSDHDPGEEWVYNRADIDHAKIVWAREIRDEDVHPLLDYFRNRNIWLAEPDADPPRLSPYEKER